MSQRRLQTYNGRKLIELLRQHVPGDFHPDDFLLAGSARLWAGGITQQLSDLDILIRPASETWQRAESLALEHGPLFRDTPLRISEYTGDRIARLYGGVIEVCQTWLLPDCDTESLLENADTIDGLRFLPISEVIAYKRLLNRPKDRADLAAIDEHFRSVGRRPRTTREYATLLIT